MPDQWRSRIVDHGTADPAELVANPRNWRIHPRRQSEALTGLLDQVGWVQQVIVNQRTGFVVDGHLRVSLAAGRGENLIPVVYVDLEEAEEALVLATFDPIGDLATTEARLLEGLAGLVETEHAALRDLIDFSPVIDPDQAWGGMPTYDQQDKTAWKSLTVNFTSAADLDRFAKTIGQPLTEKTRSIWFPPQPIERYANKAFVDEGAGGAA